MSLISVTSLISSVAAPFMLPQNSSWARTMLTLWWARESWRWFSTLWWLDLYPLEERTFGSWAVNLERATLYLLLSLLRDRKSLENNNDPQPQEQRHFKWPNEACMGEHGRGGATQAVQWAVLWKEPLRLGWNQVHHSRTGRRHDSMSSKEPKVGSAPSLWSPPLPLTSAATGLNLPKSWGVCEKWAS